MERESIPGKSLAQDAEDPLGICDDSFSGISSGTGSENRVTYRKKSRRVRDVEIFPHAHRDAKGFLGGKPADHLRCTVTGEVRATYPAFIEHQGRYYESTVAITGICRPHASATK
jgi:hypothetical protein